MNDVSLRPAAPRVWKVGALCHAIADTLDARFNPVTVVGEMTGFSRAASGHCYFSLKDESGQIRCAMFRRAAASLDFAVRDGDRVEVSGRLGVYEQRGELQLVVESMRPAGQGTLFEDFLKLKAKLEQEGLFDPNRKRALPPLPRGIGVVTSLGAAALHDVVTALQRRLPHIPVVLAPASVQGDNAPRELVQALSALYNLATDGPIEEGVHIDVIILVRGGGSMEDLWAFNDEALARTIAQSPVPLICGVGHETDFTIADFVADLRAPTPTAAAELVCEPRQTWLGAAELLEDRLTAAMTRFLDRQAQRLDLTATRMGRPSILASHQRVALLESEQRMRSALRGSMQAHWTRCTQAQSELVTGVHQCARLERERSESADLRLGLLDPSLVLKRGYAWLTVADGHPVSSVAQVQVGAKVQATLVDGVVALTVDGVRAN